MAIRKVLAHTNFNQNEAQNLVIQNLSTAPENPKAGQIYYNTGSNKYFGYNGTQWVDLSTQGAIYTDGAGIDITDFVVSLDIAQGDNAGNVTLTADSNGLSANAPTASTTQAGLIEIATDAEATAGSATNLAVNPKQLAGKVDKNANITGATKCKITYDSKGLVTAGADLAASDIPNLTLSKITDVTATPAELNILDGATLTTTELNYVDGVTSNIQEQLDALAGRGKLLAVWNPVTGKPSTDPGTLPYTYHAGDYYIVGNPGATNYRPTGTQYTGAASTTVETGTVAANDTYIFDGTTWTLLHTEQPVTTWGSITGTLSSQTDLQNALDNKVTKNTNITGATKCKITYDSKGLVTAGADLAASDIPDLSATYATLTGTQTLTNKTIDADDNTIQDLELDNFKSGVIQTTVRGTSTATDTSLATEKAVATALAAKTGKLTATNPALTVSGGQCTWTITNSIGTADVICSVREVSSGDEVYPEILYAANNITIKINASANIASGTYRAIIIG